MPSSPCLHRNVSRKWRVASAFLIETQPYQRAVSEAVQMVLRNSIIEDQRATTMPRNVAIAAKPCS